MTIESDLGPKLPVIGKRARERFAYDMRSVGELSDDGRVVPIEGGHYNSTRAGMLREWQRHFEDLESQVTTICAKLRGFFPYDTLSLRLTAGLLSSTANAGPRSSIQVNTGTASITGRLNYASVNYLQKVDALVHEGLWRGDAAEAFQREYVYALGQANALHTGYSWALAVIVQMFHEGLVSLGKDLNNIVDACIGRLPSGSTWQGEGASNLSYASLAAGAMSLIPFPPLAIPAGIVSLGAGIAGTWLGLNTPDAGPNHQPWPIEGDSAIEILAATHRAINGVDEAMNQIDSRISQVIDGYLDNPDGFADPDLEVQNPSLPTWTSKIESGQPGPIDQNPLLVPVRDLYHAGYTVLPGFAQETEAAAGICGTARLDSNLGELYPRSVGNYEAARARLERILSETSDTAYAVGAKLVTMVDNFEMTDAENAELIRQTAELTVPVPRSESTQDPDPVYRAF
ncbi:hypothetical protein BC793_12026 [Actinoplanes xinjiangensis]|uniref:Uncharacterized protein n=2 Tax=Actinoplanes xinjiangensis TaxID=512350 RepID=A0A316F5V1_9ACTN|nr:hypothetical protein BC793_12026 [Actinoplanes xinjiangensis]GIF42402.1 hypothetical protein Axi01nite_67130 [Actinoplanes xinjiangensis]